MHAITDATVFLKISSLSLRRLFPISFFFSFSKRAPHGFIFFFLFFHKHLCFSFTMITQLMPSSRAKFVDSEFLYSFGFSHDQSNEAYEISTSEKSKVDPIDSFIRIILLVESPGHLSSHYLTF